MSSFVLRRVRNIVLWVLLAVLLIVFVYFHPNEMRASLITEGMEKSTVYLIMGPEHAAVGYGAIRNVWHLTNGKSLVVFFFPEGKGSDAYVVSDVRIVDSWIENY